MKKISLFFLIILLVFLLSVPVFAAESYSFNFYGDSFIPVTNIPTIGNYRYELVIFGDTDSLTFSGISSVNSVLIDGLDTLMMPIVALFDSDNIFVVNFEFYWVYDEFENEYFAIFGSTVLMDGTNIILSIEKIESPGFIDSVNSGLSSVMSWIQSFTLSFLTGELSPLLTVFVIGICVAALFFGIISIYKICWGC